MTMEKKRQEQLEKKLADLRARSGEGEIEKKIKEYEDFVGGRYILKIRAKEISMIISRHVRGEK